MDRRFPTYQNSTIWKPENLTQRVEDSVLYFPVLVDDALERAARIPMLGGVLSKGLKKRLPQAVDKGMLYGGIDTTILDGLSTFKGITLGRVYLGTEELQAGLLIALSNVTNIYDNKRFAGFSRKLCPERTELWMSYAQMVHVGLELMKAAPKTQSLELQELYAQSVKELRTEYLKGHAYNPKESQEFLGLVGRNPKIQDINFEDLLTSAWRHQFPFRKVVSNVIISTIKHLAKQERLADYSVLDNAPGKKRGNPNFSLVCVPKEFIRR